MDWLNYHHLQYFWTVAREGSIAAASRRLHVGRPAISMQVKSLEAFLGEPLFRRQGRRLELTETGRVVQGYADEIFQAGRDLVDAVRGGTVGRGQIVRVGVADALPKLVTFALLDGALDDEGGGRLAVVQAAPRELFAALAVHDLDLVLSDVPLTPGLDVRAHGVVVGESSVSLFAVERLAAQLTGELPDALHGAPMLLPSRESAVRSSLDRWFAERSIEPVAVAEFDDSALMKVFGQAGRGVFPAPTAVTADIADRFGARPLLELSDVTERFYAITPDRKLPHPVVQRIIATAEARLFG